MMTQALAVELRGKKRNRPLGRPRPQRSVKASLFAPFLFICWLEFVSRKINVVQGWLSHSTNIRDSPLFAVPSRAYAKQAEGPTSLVTKPASRPIPRIKKVHERKRVSDDSLAVTFDHDLHKLRRFQSFVSAYDMFSEKLEVGSLSSDAAVALFVLASRTVCSTSINQENRNEEKSLTETVQPRLFAHPQDVETAKVKLPQILSVVATALFHQKLLVQEESLRTKSETNEASDLLSTYSICDILVSLSCLVRKNPVLLGDKLRPLAIEAWRLLVQRQADQCLTPHRWLACVQGAITLQLPVTDDSEDNRQNTNKSAGALLYRNMCVRLTQGDALARLSVGNLVSGLAWGVQIMQMRTEASEFNGLQPCERNALRSFNRRLRKQSVRKRATVKILENALRTTNLLLKQTNTTEQEKHTAWIGDLTKLSYTLQKETISRFSSQDVSSTTDGSLATFALLAYSARLVRLEASDPLVVQIRDLLENRASTMVSSKSTVGFDDHLRWTDVSTVLQAFEFWNLPQAKTVQWMGRTLLDTRTSAPNPSEANSILRCVFLLHRTDTETLTPYIQLSESWFRDTNFLDNCNLAQLSNFLWFWNGATVGLAKDRAQASKLVLESLVTRILRHDLINACSPKTASQIMSSFASISALHLQDDRSSLNLEGQLFHELGEHLLSIRLDPKDITRSLIAYVNAEYTHDMGIFDHLVSLFVASLPETSPAPDQVHDGNCPTVRQVTECLWACAKMIDLDNFPHDKDDTGDDDDAASRLPSFVSLSADLGWHLSRHVSELSTKDVVQGLWAFAKLGFSDAAMIDPLVARIRSLSSSLTAQEVANLLWALSKVKRTAFPEIFLLTQCARNEDVLAHLTPLEASSILYAMGALDIRDENLFHSATALIVDQIDQASAQTIANVLWAHKQVHLIPPPELLDSWGAKKLGIRPVEGGERFW